MKNKKVFSFFLSFLLTLFFPDVHPCNLLKDPILTLYSDPLRHLGDHGPEPSKREEWNIANIRNDF